MTGLEVIFVIDDSILVLSQLLWDSVPYINCGVSRGSFFGPLLFLIMCKWHFNRAVPGENIKKFADDTNLFIFDGDSDKLTQRANNCLKDLDNWFKSNKLTLNLDKTSYIVFSPRRIFCINCYLTMLRLKSITLANILVFISMTS